MKLISAKAFVALGFVFTVLSVNSLKADVTYVGTSGSDWGTATNWSDGNVPNIKIDPTNVYTINNGAAVLYSGTDGDWRNNTTVNISGSGSSWTETNNGWIKIGDAPSDTGGGTAEIGTVNITNGGSFSSGASAANIFLGNGDATAAGFVNVDATSSFSGPVAAINVQNSSIFTNHGTTSASSLLVTNTGTYTNTGSSNFANGATLSLNGHYVNSGAGLLTLNSDLRIHDGAIFDMNGGTLNGTILSFDQGGSTGVFNLNAGSVTFSRNQFGGIFDVGNASYINFSLSSTGTLLFSGYNSGTLDPAITQDFTNGLIRLNGNVDTDMSGFTITTDGSGTLIQLTSPLVAAPEPSTYAMLGLGLAVLVFIQRRRAARA